MLVRTLWSHVRGYVIIRAKGNRLEALINEAVAAGVHLWQLERASSRLLVARTEAADFARLARTGQRLGVRVTALEKRGFPFACRRARQRRALVAGGFLFAALLYVLAQFVWFIEVEGVDGIRPEAVLHAAAEAGLRPGVLRSSVRRDAVVDGLHRQLPRVAWAGIELRGALATVRVVERTEADATLHSPGDIVAVADGVVEHIVVTRGHAVVAVGDTVEASQPLIRGAKARSAAPEEGEEDELVLPADEPTTIRAEGSVWGRVWYRGYAEVAVSADGQLSPEAPSVASAKERALAAAEASIVEHLPPGADIRERDVTAYEELHLQPAIVRATVTVSVYQNLGRFVPVIRSPEAEGDGLKDERDGQSVERTRQ